MKKKKIGRKFSRTRDQRHALKKSLATSLIFKERIETTLAKAKELRPFIERLISQAKKQNVASLRYLLHYLPEKAAKKLNKEVAPRFKDRPGGYTRIIKINNRNTDAAPLAMIEFVLRQEKKSPLKSSKQKNEKAK